MSKLHVDRVSVVDLPAFGATGPYQKISGTFEGELDPANARDAVIADLALAPAVDGKVHYVSSFYILQPLDPSKSAHKLFYMFGNRGRKLELRLNDAHDSNDPTSAEDFGNGWLNRQGFILAWSGWDGSAVSGPDLLNIQLPIAKNPDGSSITGSVTVELTPMRAHRGEGSNLLDLPYAANAVDPSNGALTMREHEADPRIPVAGWRYINARQVALPAPIHPQWIYEFVYTAKDPVVMGIGHAATRDFIAFLKFATKDDAGMPNPVAAEGPLRAVYSFGRSQGGRAQRDFLYWGFNEDEAGTHRIVIDGMMPYATGSSLMWMNDRFAQPTTTVLQHYWHQGRGSDGPFTIPVVNDPLTGRTDGVLRRCRERQVCPKIVMIEGANEYWNKTTSLNHTDATGNDLDVDKLAPDLRIYSVAGIQHSAFRGDRPVQTEFCQGLTNPLYQGQLFRALIVALDAWVTNGVLPPPRRIPTRRDGSLVDSDAVRFPRIPGIAFDPSAINSVSVMDYSGGLAQEVPGKRYAVLVSQVDKDGNDLGGVRMPFLTVPLGTYTGWNLLKPGMGGPDLCLQNGQFIPFAKTRVERLARGDPRLSLEERYGGLARYGGRLKTAILDMVRQRLLLAEDAQSLFDEGLDMASAAGLSGELAGIKAQSGLGQSHH